MSTSWQVHKLTQLINCKSDVKVSESTIQKRANEVVVFGAIGERITIKFGELDTRCGWGETLLGSKHIGTIENVNNILGLGEMKSILVTLGMEAQKI